MTNNNSIIGFAIGVVIVVIIVAIVCLTTKESVEKFKWCINLPFGDDEETIEQVKQAVKEKTGTEPTQEQAKKIVQKVKDVQKQSSTITTENAVNGLLVESEKALTDKKELTDDVKANIQKIIDGVANLTKEQIDNVVKDYKDSQESKQQSKQPQTTQQSKENFLALGDRAYIDAQGDIGGSRIMTNGMLNQPYDEIKASIQDNKPLKDNSALGVARGDDLESAYSAYKSILDIQENDPTAVRSTKEMADIAKQISATQNNSSSNILTRAGSSKAKIVMDPLGTVGVCDQYTTPERDRNHKIYSVAHAVHVPGFEIDTNRINQELTASPGWSKNFATTTISAISSAGAMEGAAKEAQQAGIVQSESFSSRNYVSY